jgi:hypothetical protein
MRAGVLYFALVFAAGFVLGTLRVLIVAPAGGETAAVLAELPVMLLIAWHACRWLTARLWVPGVPPPRAVMGALAFVLLNGAEAMLGAVLGRPPAAQLAALATPAGLAGLAGQVAFALMPLAQAWRSGPGRGSSRP